MAHAARVQLHRRHAGFFDLQRVDVGFQVGLDDAQLAGGPGAQLADEREQKRGLAGAGACHDVDEERALGGTLGAECVGGLVVCG